MPVGSLTAHHPCSSTALNSPLHQLQTCNPPHRKAEADGGRSKVPTPGQGLDKSPSLQNHCGGGGSGCSHFWVRGMQQMSGHCAVAWHLALCTRLPGVGHDSGLENETLPSLVTQGYSFSLPQGQHWAPPWPDHQPSSDGYLGSWLKGTDLGGTSRFPGGGNYSCGQLPARAQAHSIPQARVREGRDRYGH